jgi:hypothetical protein
MLQFTYKIQEFHIKHHITIMAIPELLPQPPVDILQEPKEQPNKESRWSLSNLMGNLLTFHIKSTDFPPSTSTLNIDVCMEFDFCY